MKFELSLLLLCIPAQLAWPQAHAVLKLDVAKALETPGDCRLSSIASQVHYVPLEAKPGSFIQNIDQYAISDDLILVADNKVGKVMKFDRAGKYMGDFMVKGKGPGEFTWIYGLDINSAGEILVCKEGSGIDIFGRNGKLINGFNHDGLSTARWLTDEKILLVADYMLSGGKVIETLDRLGQQSSIGLRTSLDLSSMRGSHYYRLAGCREGFYYWDPLFDTVYTINFKGEVYPRTVFRHRMDHVTQKDWLTGAYQDKMIRGEAYDIVGYYEFREKIVMMGIVKSNCILEFDRATAKGFVQLNSIYFGLLNDLDKGPEFLPKTVLPDGSAAMFLRPQEDLIRYIDWVLPKSGRVLPGSYDIKLYQKLADYGNPVLMIVR